MNLPIDITNQDPATFSFTDQELGLTPVTTNDAIKIPAIFDISYYDSSYSWETTPLALVGSPVSIWIGKDASVDLLIPEYMGDTWRHEIQSLAFEDGRTNLVENVTVHPITSYYDYDSQESAALEAEAEAAYEAAHQAWEDGGEVGDEPDYYDDYYYDCRYYDSWNRNTRQFIYLTKTINDATDSYPLNHWSNWHGAILTKSLRLPEGISNFGQFSFMHSCSDYVLPQDTSYDYQQFQHPTDFRIFIPNTVTHFNIIGAVSYNDSAPNGGSSDFSTEYGNSDMAWNNLSFNTWRENMTGGGLWIGNVASSDFPDDVEDLPQFLEDHPHDTVHIYLRNHQTVPLITFYGRIYFPIVFHINGVIENQFRSAYQGAVQFNPLAARDSYSTAYDYDPVTIVADFGTFEITNDTPLSETKFASVALSGSYNDLADKPAIPSDGVSSYDDLEDRPCYIDPPVSFGSVELKNFAHHWGDTAGDQAGMITAGSFIPLALEHTYDITVNGTLYTGIEVKTISEEMVDGTIGTWLYLGNRADFDLRYEGVEEADGTQSLTVATKRALTLASNDLPFVISHFEGYTGTNPQAADTSTYVDVGVIIPTGTLVNPIQEITVTDTTDSSKTYTIQFDATDQDYELGWEGMYFALPMGFEEACTAFEAEDGNEVDVAVNGTVHTGTWVYDHQYEIDAETGNQQDWYTYTIEIPNDDPNAVAEGIVLKKETLTTYDGDNDPTVTVTAECVVVKGEIEGTYEIGHLKRIKTLDTRMIPTAAAIEEDAEGFVPASVLYEVISALETRIADLESQMTVNSNSTSSVEDFNEIEPENSSDYVVTGYEPEE